MTMKSPRHIFGLCALALLCSSVSANSDRSADRPAAEISGEVSLVPPQSGHPADAAQVAVWLVPMNVLPGMHAPEQAHYRLLQRNKHFEPGLLVVPVGSVVDFPNADPWFHNVFSLYRGKRFDLGLYQAGAQRSVRFDRVGPSYLFCNIHPEMKGVVLAVDSDLFNISDKTGHYMIAGIPPGKYLLHVWYEGAKPDVLQTLQRVVVVESGDRVLPVIAIPVVKQMPTGHKNKYGQDYDPDTLKPDY